MTVLLADTSVWHRRAHGQVVERWADAVLADTVGTTQPVRLEVLYSARSAQDYDQIDDELDGLIQIQCTVEAMDRALEVQRKLSEKGRLHHRSVRIPDLLIAAAAELAEAVVWHYDEDFDRIAAVTGQAAEWIVPRGSL